MDRPDLLWSVLVPTLSSRQGKFLDLMGVLLPQCEADGRVEVVTLHNDGERDIAEYRQALLEDARGEYVSFVDDDDMVAPDFVPVLAGLLAGRPDAAGFTVEYSAPGVGPLPSYNSLAHEPRDEPGAFYRDLTHVQPVRAELARKGDFRAGWPEDGAWRKAVRPLLETEAVTERVLYFYRHDPSDSVQTKVKPHAYAPRPAIASPAFRWHPWSTG